MEVEYEYTLLAAEYRDCRSLWDGPPYFHTL